MNIKIKRLTNTATIPTRGSVDAAGYDLYADTDKPIGLPPHTTYKFPTNISMEIPNGYFGGIYARSGIATKRGLRPSNCVGIVDSDYRGNIVVALHNDSEEYQMIEPNERIAQIIIQPYLNVEFNVTNELSDTERGIGGFGSTGSK